MPFCHSHVLQHARLICLQRCKVTLSFHCVSEVDSFTSWPKSPGLGNSPIPTDVATWSLKSNWTTTTIHRTGLANLRYKKAQHWVTGKEIQEQHGEMEKRKPSSESDTPHSCPTGLPGHAPLEDKRKCVIREICDFQKKMGSSTLTTSFDSYS